MIILKRLILISLFVLFFVNLYSNNSQHAIDSLKNELLKEKNTNDKVADLLSLIGTLYYQQSDFPQAISYKKQATDCYEKKAEYKKQGETLEQIGVMYSIIGDFNNSLECFFKALKVFEKNKDLSSKYSLLLNIGVTYLDAEDKVTALKYFIEVIAFYEKQDKQYSEYLFAAYLNTGVLYNKLNNTSNSLLYFKKGLDLIKKYPKLEKHNGDLQVNLGDVYLKENKYNEAMEAFSAASVSFKRSLKYRGYWHSIYSTSLIYKAKGDFTNATKLLEESIIYFKENLDPQYLKDSYNTLSQIYEAQNNYKLALQYNKLSQEINDSLLSSDVQNQMSNMQTKYELEKLNQETQKDIELIEKDKELNSVKWAAFVTILIIIIVVILLILNRRNIQKKFIESKLENETLEKQNLQAEIDFKNKDLQNFALHIVQKNELLENIKADIKSIKNSSDKTQSEKIQNLSIQISNSLKINKELEVFQSKVDELNSSYLVALDKKFPDLTEKEKKLCILLKLNLSSKEIAVLNEITEGAVTMARYRLRKRMNLSNDENLVEYLQKIN